MMNPLTDEERREIEQDGFSNQEKVAKLMAIALMRLGAISRDKPVFSGVILDAIRNLYPRISGDLAEGTIGVYLNRSPAFDDKIISLGTAQGYYLDEAGDTRVSEDPDSTADMAGAEPQAEESSANPEQKAGGKLRKERLLYDHVMNWVIANGYRAKVVSEGKSLGPWGNPDVVGIQAIDSLGSQHAHTVSIEVKLNQTDWKKKYI